MNVRMRGNGVVLVFIVSFMLIKCVNSDVMHNVGLGKDWSPIGFNYSLSQLGWRLGKNYTQWAANRHFYVGESLYFIYNYNISDVLFVNDKDYSKCSSDHPIKNISEGAGLDVFNLSEAKPYYFISSGGRCQKGMRLSVLVDPPPQKGYGSTIRIVIIRNETISQTVIFAAIAPLVLVLYLSLLSSLTDLLIT